MGNVNQKGRNKRDKIRGHFTALPDFMTDSVAWQTMSCQARCVYFEVHKKYRGDNNGALVLGVREAADKANVNKNTASACFKMLVERGFVEVVQEASFTTKTRLATVWRLTLYRCHKTGKQPTKAFMRWSPANLNNGMKSSPPRYEMEAQPQLNTAPTVPSFQTKAAI